MPRMMHPLHGWHVASAADDIAAMRKAGWVDDDGKALAAKLAPAVVTPATEGDAHIALLKAVLTKTFPPGDRQDPAPEAPKPEADPRDAARAELDALGIKWDARWGLKKLIAAKG